MTPDEARVRIAALCESLSASDPRFAVAAGVLRGGRPGRKAKDDAAGLAHAQALVAAGMTQRGACRFLATLTQPGWAVSAASERLRRKLRGTNK